MQSNLNASKKFQLEGTRIAYENSSGHLMIKEGSINAWWVNVWSSGMAANKFQLENDWIVIFDTGGHLRGKAGGLSTSWKDLYAGPMNSFTVTGTRIVFNDGVDHIRGQENSNLYSFGFSNGLGPWKDLWAGFNWFKADGDRIVARDNSSHIRIQDPTLQWRNFSDMYSGNVDDLVLTGNKVIFYGSNIIHYQERSSQSGWWNNWSKFQ